MTFYHYICSDISKRRILGGTAGCRRLMSIEDINLVGKTLARYDRANSGMDPRDERAFVPDVDPSISKE